MVIMVCGIVQVGYCPSGNCPGSLFNICIYIIYTGFIQLFEPRIKLRSGSEVSNFFIYRFLLDNRKLLLNVNCGVKIVVLFVASCGIKWYVFYVLPLFVRSLHVAAFLWA